MYFSFCIITTFSTYKISISIWKEDVHFRWFSCNYFSLFTLCTQVNLNTVRFINRHKWNFTINLKNVKLRCTRLPGTIYHYSLPSSSGVTWCWLELQPHCNLLQLSKLITQKFWYYLCLYTLTIDKFQGSYQIINHNSRFLAWIYGERVEDFKKIHKIGIFH